MEPPRTTRKVSIINQIQRLNEIITATPQVAKFLQKYVERNLKSGEIQR